jgi:hypothetical protein
MLQRPSRRSRWNEAGDRLAPLRDRDFFARSSDAVEHGETSRLEFRGR